MTAIIKLPVMAMLVITMLAMGIALAVIWTAIAVSAFCVYLFAGLLDVVCPKRNSAT